jgi:hypothetical protein
MLTWQILRYALPAASRSSLKSEEYNSPVYTGQPFLRPQQHRAAHSQAAAALLRWKSFRNGDES